MTLYKQELITCIGFNTRQYWPVSLEWVTSTNEMRILKNNGWYVAGIIVICHHLYNSQSNRVHMLHTYLHPILKSSNYLIYCSVTV